MIPEHLLRRAEDARRRQGINTDSASSGSAPVPNPYDRGQTDQGEVRVVDPVTGAAKGSKLSRFDLVPANPLRELAEHYGKGSLKYDDNNWRKGYAWSLSIAALERHLNAFKAGEDYDEETGSKHIIAVAWHAFALAEFMDSYRDKDDRWKGRPTSAEEATGMAAEMLKEVRDDLRQGSWPAGRTI